MNTINNTTSTTAATISVASSTTLYNTSIFIDENKQIKQVNIEDLNQEDQQQEQQSTNHKRLRSTYPFGKCRVCNDKATGIHYGVATCEGCKGFFKRSTMRKEKYRCFFGNQCPLMPENRNRCKACRFRICLEVGMSMEAVKMGRIPKAEKERAIQEQQQKQRIVDIKEDTPQKRFNSTDDDDDDDNYDDQINPKRLKAFTNKTNTNYLVDRSSLSSSLSSSSPSLLSPSIYIRQPQYNPQYYIPKQSTNEVSSFIAKSLFNTVPVTSYESLLVPVSTSQVLLPQKEPILQVKPQEEQIKIDKETLNEIIFNYQPNLNTPNNNNIITSSVAYLKLAPMNMDIVINTSANNLHSLHSKDMKSVKLLTERAHNLIRYGITTYIGHDASIEMVWEGLVISIPQHVKALIVYAKELPGFSEIKNDDFAAIINRRLFDFFMLKHAYLLVNNESFMMLPNNIQYTRSWMTKVIGHEMVQAMFDFSELFHDCKLTERELSILIPFVLTSPANRLRDNYKLEKLHDFYTKILIHEMNLNKRTPEFLNKLSFILAQLPILHELETRSIRAISPQSGLDVYANSLCNFLAKLDCLGRNLIDNKAIF